jgi:hypothetical protein
MPDLKSFLRPVLLLSEFLLGALLLAACSPRVNVDALVASYDEKAQYSELKITSPLDATIFPPDLAPFTFSWQDPGASDSWLLAFQTADKSPPLVFVSREQQWTPNPQQWETLKERSREKPASALVLGFQRKDASKVLSAVRISISTSKDPVGAPVFYREVILPFMEAVKDPSRIRWRFGSVSSLEAPPVVLDKLPVCGNCHSFSADGHLLGMDVDYANNKGSYVLTRVAKEISMAATNVMTWDG